MAAAAAIAAAVAVKGYKDYAFAAFIGDFALHIVKPVKSFTVKICKFFVAHKKHLLKNIISEGGEKNRGKKF